MFSADSRLRGQELCAHAAAGWAAPDEGAGYGEVTRRLRNVAQKCDETCKAAGFFAVPGVLSCRSAAFGRNRSGRLSNGRTAPACWPLRQTGCSVPVGTRFMGVSGRNPAAARYRIERAGPRFSGLDMRMSSGQERARRAPWDQGPGGLGFAAGRRSVRIGYFLIIKLRILSNFVGTILGAGSACICSIVHPPVGG